MVEFALSFMVFLTVLVGVVEFSRLSWTATTVSNATRETARFLIARGSANPATNALIRQVAERSTLGIDNSSLGIVVTWEDGDAATPAVTDPALASRGDMVSVQLTYPFQFGAAKLFGFSQTLLNFTNTSTMLVMN